MYTAYYEVWYRHSGEEEIDEIPGFTYRKIVKDVGEITTDIGDNYITHMSLYGDILPTLSTVAPQLTHLRIRLTDYSELERYVDEVNNSTRNNVMILYLIVRDCIYNWRNIQ